MMPLLKKQKHSLKLNFLRIKNHYINHFTEAFGKTFFNFLKIIFQRVFFGIFNEGKP